MSSIGIARSKDMLPGTIDGMKHVCYFRHALALDERRVKFLPEYAYGGTSTPSVTEAIDDNCSASKVKSTGRRPHTLEVWFAGTHSDM